MFKTYKITVTVTETRVFTRTIEACNETDAEVNAQDDLRFGFNDLPECWRCSTLHPREQIDVCAIED